MTKRILLTVYYYEKSNCYEFISSHSSFLIINTTCLPQNKSLIMCICTNNKIDFEIKLKNM